MTNACTCVTNLVSNFGLKIYAHTCALSMDSFMSLVGLNTHDIPYINETMVRECAIVC